MFVIRRSSDGLYLGTSNVVVRFQRYARRFANRKAALDYMKRNDIPSDGVTIEVYDPDEIPAITRDDLKKYKKMSDFDRFD